MRLLCPIAAAVNSVHHAGLAVGRLPTAMTIIAMEAIVIRKAAIQNRRRGHRYIPEGFVEMNLCSAGCDDSVIRCRADQMVERGLIAN